MEVTDSASTTRHEFKAEIRQLLDILVHSLYTNREVFLRELVSNASDALEKLRFETARGTVVADPGVEPEIRITTDKDAKIVRIADSGIGMSRDEVIAHIGTIAQSGSAQFLKASQEQGEKLDGIIGKFGIGFYSVFMAAKEVVLRTRSFRPDDEPVEWKSDGLGAYEIAAGPASTPRGAEIEVHLRDEALEFANAARLKEVIRQHSKFISFPILVDGERVNTTAALWREPKFSIKKEQYEEFYKFLTHDTDAPFDTIHLSVDAPVQFNALMFVPADEIDMQELMGENIGLDLYVRRVLIQHRCRALLPEYLAFLRGVVDSEDLPLNISREVLQESALFAKIRSSVAKQAINHLAKLAKDSPERYEEFWKTHGKVFRLGYNDWANREKFTELLRYESSNGDGLTSFDAYIARARENQKQIYYAVGPSRQAIAQMPHLEAVRARGLEVLYLYDPIDEFVLQSVGKVQEFDITSVEQADAKTLESFTPVAPREKAEPLSADDEAGFDKLLGRMKDILGDRVTDVRVSARLSESPCCLASPDGVTSTMQRMMRVMNKDASIPKQSMEVNRDHPLLRNLLSIWRANPDAEYVTLATEQLFESALLQEGYMNDPHEMIARIQKLLTMSSGWHPR